MVYECIIVSLLHFVLMNELVLFYIYKIDWEMA